MVKKSEENETMKLYEFEGKSLFAEEGIPTPQGFVAYSPEEVEKNAANIGKSVVIKSQILQGGRGKAGGIKFADAPGEAKELSKEIFGMKLHDYTVDKVLVEEKLDIAKEYYLSVTIDAEKGSPLIMASMAGGVDIEEVAKETPEKIVMETVDIFKGLLPYQARRIAYKMGLTGKEAFDTAEVMLKIYNLFRKYDADLVEINPLVVTGEGTIVAADSKISIYDNALYRQPKFIKTRDHYDSEIEYEASQVGLGYIKLGGNIGLCCAGAGLTMMTLDLVHYYGGKTSNFLEFGGAQYRNAYNALDLVLRDPEVKVVLVNVFGLIARADVIAQGLAEAIKALQPKVPIVVSLRGTGEAEGHKTLKDELGLIAFWSAEEAVKEAIRLGGSN